MAILLRICNFLLDIFFPIKSIRGKYTAHHVGAVDPYDLNVHHKMSLLRSHIGVSYTLEYKKDSVKRMVWRFKYYLNKDALKTCTYILYDQLIADVSDRVGKLPFQAPSILIHYPSSTYFRGDKSFDHMEELTRLLDSFQSVHNPFFICCTHAVLPRLVEPLHKIQYTPQHLGTRRQRFEWSKKRFVISSTFGTYMEKRIREGVPTTHIYCIDDIVTTGSSMHAVSKMLNEKFNVEVIKFCICH